MRARSPIEMMVDKACGFDPNAPEANAVATPVRRTVVDRDTQVLMNVGDAAVAWLKQRGEAGTEAGLRDAERVLAQCARELAATGW